jgi:hypothetical protein
MTPAKPILNAELRAFRLATLEDAISSTKAMAKSFGKWHLPLTITVISEKVFSGSAAKGRANVYPVRPLFPGEEPC